MEIREESPSYLEEYARVSIAFEVDCILELSVRNDGLGGFALSERPLMRTFVKDYDAIPGNHPTDWARRFDLSNWGLLSARLGGEQVGGAAVASQTPGLFMLEDRSDLAVLWDIRVAPHARGRGIGAALFSSAEQWAEARSCCQLKIETQNINVPACRFYASQGCTLGAIHRFPYSEFPEEVQLLWYKSLGDHA
jgi:GNAT superfamily N-acetyltransferase